METKISPQKFEKMLESFINGNRNDHRIDYWMMSRPDQMAYLKYCLDTLDKSKYKDLLDNLRYPMKDEY